MPVRISITTDHEMMELVDRYAKEHGVDRNRALLALIESGLSRTAEGEPVNLNQKRAFEEYRDIRNAVDGMQQSLQDLSSEVKLIHHIIDVEWGPEMRPVPYQSRRWWEFWKSP